MNSVSINETYLIPLLSEIKDTILKTFTVWLVFMQRKLRLL